MSKTSSIKDVVMDVSNDINNDTEKALSNTIPNVEDGEMEKKEPIMSRPLAITMIVLFIMCFVVHFVCTGIRGEGNVPDSNGTSTITETE